MITGVNIISSIGALHKFNKKFFDKVADNQFKIPKINLVSIILGGSNNHYNFSLNEINELIYRINNIKNNNPKYNFLIIFSRRTGNLIKKTVKNKLHNKIILWDENKPNPYAFCLKYSEYFIVTSDSTSMISECSFTAQPIYIFHLPFKRISKRIKKFHNKFSDLGITRDLITISKLSKWIYKPLNESKRIASIIKERIIKEHT